MQGINAGQCRAMQGICLDTKGVDDFPTKKKSAWSSSFKGEQISFSLLVLRRRPLSQYHICGGLNNTKLLHIIYI